MTSTMISAPLAAAAASTTVPDIVARFHDLAVHDAGRVAVIDAHRTVTFAEHITATSTGAR